MAKAVLSAQHVVADEVMLLLDLTNDRVGAADQRQAIVDPEIVGPGALPEDPAQLQALWCSGFPSVHAVRPIPGAGPCDRVLSGGTESGVRHTRRGEMFGGLCLRLCVSLRDMHMTRQEGARHGTGMTTLLPELAPGSEFFGDHRVDIDVLGNVEVAARRVLKARCAVRSEPDRRMGLLVRLGRGHNLKELKELTIVGHTVFSPCLNDDVKGRLADLPAAFEGHVPAQEFVGGHAGTRPKLQPPPRQMVQHCRVLRQPYRMMKGQLIDHDPKPDGTGTTRQGRQVDVGRTEIANGGGLMLDGEIVLIPQLLRFLDGANMLVVDLRRRGSL